MVEESPSLRSLLGGSLASAFLAGVLGGELFLGLGLLRGGSDLLTTSPSMSFAFWIVLRSVGLYGLLFGAFGLLLGVLLVGFRVLARRPRGSVFPEVAGTMVALCALAYLTVRWQIDVLQGLPMGDPTRWWGAGRHLVLSLIIGGLAGLALRWRGGRLAGPWSRSLAAAATAALLLTLLVALGGAALAPAPGRGATGNPASARPRRVVMVGLDGLTFRVLSPLLRQGELPAFRRLLAEGAWGSILTYGTASSPRVWTSLSTGKRVRDHGIDDFVKPASGYAAEPFKSFDRKSQAIWNILGRLGLRVGVVNWLLTFPPEEVNGYVVARLAFDEKNSTYPLGLREEIEPLLLKAPSRPEPERGVLLEDVDRTFAVARHVLRKEPIGFLALYTAAPDEAQHFYWKEYDPTRFDPKLWRERATSASPSKSVIAEVYESVDRGLGELMGSLPDGTLLVVVSDHGQLAALRPRVRLRMDLLLQDLGYGVARPGPAGGPDYDRSRAYALVETPWRPYLRINLNVSGREPSGIVEPGDAARLAEELARALHGLKLDDGTRLFGRVSRASFGADFRRRGADSDIRADLSHAARSAPSPERTILVNGRTHPVDRFLEINTSISGDHDHQGVVFLWGPAVRPGPIGQGVVSTPLQELVWYLTDKVDAIDLLLPPLRALGMIERVTTLDLTPTVLYALGLPAARDMTGRPRSDLFSGLGEPRWIATYEGAARPSRSAAPTSDEELLERLRSLGYIN